MVSKNQKKLIKSLYQKKYRKQHGLFVAEGKKVIQELLQAKLELHALFTTEDGIFEVNDQKKYLISHEELKQISFLTTPQVALAVFVIPEVRQMELEGVVLVLDDVRDPGNLGTIIRLCDWFGVKELVCSNQTVDCYNPKVVQATMGSITRVNIVYQDIEAFLFQQKPTIPIYGTFMEGDNIYDASLPKKGVIVMGNEANGISTPVEKIVDKRITIPQFGLGQKTESLNVATATAIILSEFKRKSS